MYLIHPDHLNTPRAVLRLERDGSVEVGSDRAVWGFSARSGSVWFEMSVSLRISPAAAEHIGKMFEAYAEEMAVVLMGVVAGTLKTVDGDDPDRPSLAEMAEDGKRLASSLPSKITVEYAIGIKALARLPAEDIHTGDRDVGGGWGECGAACCPDVLYSSRSTGHTAGSLRCQWSNSVEMGSDRAVWRCAAERQSVGVWEFRI